MIQLVQHQKSGEILSLEMPPPICLDGGILVQLSNSLISAGTEKASVDNAKGSLLTRAKKQPDQVKLVLETVKEHGISSTISRVKNKLDSFKVLGYSGAGIVTESRCDAFSVGDRVAVGGAGYANHAEIVSVPEKLAIKIPSDVSFEDASYTTVASIAMQGVRQADPRIGESVAVIGLGLLGIITIQLLKASGCRVAGIDINENLFEQAKKFGADECYKSSPESINSLLAFTRGMGFDSVIITAGTSSSAPMDLSMEITRQRGTVVIVGAVGTELKRNPWYRKEINLKISCSYGPGRYDSDYEEFGNDYPFAFVRWTENRNMESVIDLISSGSLNVSQMTTHDFKIEDAPKAFELISTGAEAFLGVVINYDEKKKHDNKFIINTKYKKSKGKRLAFIGLGSFAQNYLIPALKQEDLDFYAVSNSSSASAKTASSVNNFEIATTDSEAIIKDENTDFVFIASRHSSHAKFICEAVKSGKAVFAEKPIAVNLAELRDITNLVGKHKGRVMCGFNRRFSPIFKSMKQYFATRKEPMQIVYRVNAGKIPKGHWVQQDSEGGRIIGEVCHFIDTCIFLTGELPVSVFAQSVSGKDISMVNRDNISISLKMSGGSICNIEYIASGGKSMPKEFCEVFCEGKSAQMDNFKSLNLFDSQANKQKTFSGDKGISQEIKETVASMKLGKEMPISFEELYATTLTTFKILESLSGGQAVEIAL
jgi:predicted dehydrogenase/threonine dehydrogenase-like Zn-dependent dehydrogenase